MLEVHALLAAYDRQVRRSEWSNLPLGAKAEVDGPVVRIVGTRRGFIGAPVDLGIDGEELDALIARQRDYFAARGEAVEWKTRGHDLPRTIVARLRAAGFMPEAEETVMIGATSEIAGSGAHQPRGVTIRQVGEEAGIQQVVDLEREVLQEDLGWLAEELISRLRVAGQETLVLVAEAAGRVVSAGWLQFNPGSDFALLSGGSTRLEWRHRGIYRALVRRRAELAGAEGVPYLQVDASAASRPVLERLGFRSVTTTTAYVWAPAD